MKRETAMHGRASRENGNTTPERKKSGEEALSNNGSNDEHSQAVEKRTPGAASWRMSGKKGVTEAKTIPEEKKLRHPDRTVGRVL